MTQKIYLDYNASTPLAPEVLNKMVEFLNGGFYGNPSALNWAGQPLKEKLNKARMQVARLISCSPDEIIFTSGGSEANNLALKGFFYKHNARGNHIITSTIEHPAILKTCHFLEQLGAKITYVGVDQFGRVSPKDIEKAITKETILISIMHSNNEVGTIQPIKEIAEIAKKHNISLHTDASQSISKIHVNVKNLEVDLLTIAGHKLYAPKGIGALYIKDGIELESLIHGGGQEFGLRAGTENTFLAVGLGEACEFVQNQINNNGVNDVKNLTDYFWRELKNEFGEKVVLNGHFKQRLPNTLNVSFVHKVGQDILSLLPNLAASTGSACHSGNIQLSPVLREMGVSQNIGMGAIRFSLGLFTTKEEIDQTLQLLKKNLKPIIDR